MCLARLSEIWLRGSIGGLGLSPRCRDYFGESLGRGGLETTVGWAEPRFSFDGRSGPDALGITIEVGQHIFLLIPTLLFVNSFSALWRVARASARFTRTAPVFAAGSVWGTASAG